MAMLLFLVTQVVAVGLALAIGIVFALASNWAWGIVAGVITYATVMNLFWHLEIFSMIGSGKKKGKKMPPPGEFEGRTSRKE